MCIYVHIIWQGARSRVSSSADNLVCVVGHQIHRTLRINGVGVSVYACEAKNESKRKTRTEYLTYTMREKDTWCVRCQYILHKIIPFSPSLSHLNSFGEGRMELENYVYRVIINMCVEYSCGKDERWKISSQRTRPVSLYRRSNNRVVCSMHNTTKTQHVWLYRR